MTIDTLEYVKELEAAGVDRKQAEAHAKAAARLIAGEAATRADLAGAATRLEAKIDTGLAALEMRLIKYMIAQSIGIVGLILAGFGVLIRLFLR